MMRSWTLRQCVSAAIAAVFTLGAAVPAVAGVVSAHERCAALEMHHCARSTAVEECCCREATPDMPARLEVPPPNIDLGPALFHRERPTAVERWDLYRAAPRHGHVPDDLVTLFSNFLI